MESAKITENELRWALPEGLEVPPARLATARRLVRLGYSHDLLRVSFGEVSLLTQLVKGAFPDYRQLIPQGGPSVLSHQSRTPLLHNQPSCSICASFLTVTQTHEKETGRG